MSDPSMDQEANADEEARTPDNALNMGTTAVGGPVDVEPTPDSGPDDSPIDPDSGMPLAARKIP